MKEQTQQHALLCKMMQIRRFEETICEVYGAQEMKSPVHLCIGEEAIPAGVCAHLNDDDYATSTHRNHGVCLAKGVPPMEMFAECYGKATGCCKGQGGSPHCASIQHGIYGTSAIVGGGVPLALGLALAAHMRKTQQISVVFFGDGAFEEGTTTECLNYASLHALPMLFVCTNNFYATVSPLRARQPDDNIWQRAAPYMPSELVDGSNVRAVSTAAQTALQAIRAGNGPYFLECRAYRWKEHVGPLEDWTRGARPKSELDSWQERCPIKRETQALLEACSITQAQIDGMFLEIDREIGNAVTAAQNSPWPDYDACKRSFLTE